MEEALDKEIMTQKLLEEIFDPTRVESMVRSKKSIEKQRFFVNQVATLCERYNVRVIDMDSVMQAASEYVISMVQDYYRAGVERCGKKHSD